MVVQATINRNLKIPVLLYDTNSNVSASFGPVLPADSESNECQIITVGYSQFQKLVS